MRLSLLLPCVVMGGLIGVSVFGQSGAEPTPTAEPYRDAEFEAVEEPQPIQPQLRRPQPQSSPAESVVQEEQELRRQYQELMEQQSDLMDRTALREAISRAEQDIDELRAAEKLDEARVILAELVKTHPATKAAACARTMLLTPPPGGADRPTFSESQFDTPKSYLKFDEETGLYVPAPFGELRMKRAESATEDAPFYQP